jgi:hypothetical protein
MTVLYADPNSAGGDGTTKNLSGATAAFASIAAWEAAVDGVLSDAQQCVCCRDGAAKDTSPPTINGSTTTVDYYLDVTVDPAYSCGGKANAAKQLCEFTDVTGFTINDDHVRIRGLQIQLVSPTATNRRAITIGSIAAANAVYIEDNVIIGHNDATYYIYGVYCGDSDLLVRIGNNVIYGISNNASSRGIMVDAVTTCYLYRNTIAVGAGARGLYANAGSTVAQNTIILGSTAQCFTKSAGGALSCDYCASSDDTADDQGGTGNRVSQAFTFVNAAAGDYHLDGADTGAQGYGIDLSGDGSYPLGVDIDGDTVPASGVDIGADQIVDGGGTSIVPISMHYALTGMR